MTQTILYQDQEVSVYGWKHDSKQVMGHASFSCPLTLQVGSLFTLKNAKDIFKITWAGINLHKARKIGKSEGTPEAIFPKYQFPGDHPE